MTAKKYAVLLSYLGTGYNGWQIQAHPTGADPTIQEACESTLEKMIGTRVHWAASGRTDTGVHAMGQVASFAVDWGAEFRGGKSEISAYHLMRGLNTLLPSAIRVLDLVEAPADFHPQIQAEKKQYSYYIQTGIAPSALHEPYSRFVRGRLDVAAMNESIRHLLGEHDCKPFQAAGSKPLKSTVRTIFEAEVVECPPAPPFAPPIDSLRMIRIRVVGSGFLRHMVRGIAGTLMEVGLGKRPASDMAEILRTGNRELVGKTAAAQGLWLEKVWYPNVAFGATPHPDLRA
ncbi:MAG: tRNA pseudouridine(38-40) synthase TruA [Bdellovibrionales bacterium]|nr:tRNA pseudouridine(38-40) synthase TruA [Bdellovibrionales bacterium]